MPMDPAQRDVEIRRLYREGKKRKEVMSELGISDLDMTRLTTSLGLRWGLSKKDRAEGAAAVTTDKKVPWHFRRDQDDFGRSNIRPGRLTQCLKSGAD